jgi:hypothetical protein
MSPHSVVTRLVFVVLCLCSLALLPNAAAAAEPPAGDPGLYTFARLVPSGTKTWPARTAFAVTTSDTFEGFVRYPAEEQFFMLMPKDPDAFGYFRDFFSGGEVFADSANDGDTLNAQIMFPGGTPQSFFPITFHSTFNGQKDCWVGGFPPVSLCGSQSIDVTWFVNTQCGPTIGTYLMSFSRNGNNYFTGSFRIKPTINPEKVAAFVAPTYNQGNYPDTQYGDFCTLTVTDPKGKTKQKTGHCKNSTTPDPPKVFIQQLGCLLTAYAATLNYHGVTTTPTDLNTWLTNHEGFDDGGAIHPGKIVEYAHTKGVNLRFRRQPATDALQAGNVLNGIARTAICAKGLTPIKVKHHSRDPNSTTLHEHFVAAWGRSDAEDTYKLKDPNGGADRDLSSTTRPFDYSNNYYGTRELEGTGVTFTFPGNVTLTLHSPAELLLTDPSGLRTGIDPTTGATFAEIPGAAYSDDSFDDPDDDTGEPARVDAKVLDFEGGAPGTYSLTVTGTGSGSYDLEITSLDPSFQKSHTAVEEMPVSPGSKQTYTFTLPIAPGGTVPLAGGFDGGGQRPRDVNHFLSYANPTSSQTDLPAGTTTLPLMIFYDTRDIASTFSATLEGSDVSGLFHPSPGSFERVEIPVHSGRNVLQLSIDGNLPNRVATDSDRLVLSVP